MSIPTEQRRTPIPRDERLPQIAQLLDAEAMESFLARSLGRDELSGGVQIRYLRYRHGKNLVVHYETEIDGVARHAVSVASSKHDLSAEPARPEHRERATRVEGRSPGTPFSYVPDLRALIYWLPFDPDLPALSEAPASLRARLEAAGVEVAAADGEPLLLQYRPRRRATLRLGRHVVKIYRYDDDYADGTRGLQASALLGSLRTARGEAFVPEWRLTVQELLPGNPPARRADAARDAGAVLAALHASTIDGLPPHLPADRLQGVAESVRLVAAVAPALAERAESLLRRLEAEAPDPDILVASHGDFHGGQLLQLAGGQYAVIDFDLLGAAAPALDVANYAGHLVAQEGLDLTAAASVVDALADGYGKRPPGLPWYLSAAILRSCRGPFKRFEPDWPDRIETTLGAAEAAHGL